MQLITSAVCMTLRTHRGEASLGPTAETSALGLGVSPDLAGRLAWNPAKLANADDGCCGLWLTMAPGRTMLVAEE